MPQQLYFVALVPGEPAESEIHIFKKDLHERFGTKAALKSPVHITLFPPFRFHDTEEEELKIAMRVAAQNFSPFTVVMENFDCFFPRVIFVNIKKNGELEKLQRSVKSVFFAVPGIKSRKYTDDFHAHATIGNRDWTIENFRAAWEEYKLKKYSASFVADKISLLRLDKGKWEIVSEEKLGD